MTSGYLMVESALKDPNDRILGFPVPLTPREPWRFLELEPFMKQANQNTLLIRQLKVANHVFFKVWLLMRQLQIVASVLIVMLICLFGYVAYSSWQGEILRLTVKDAFFIVLAAALSLLGLGFMAKLVNYHKTATEILIGIGMATVGFLVARVHLHVFDKLFLWQGSLQRLLARQHRRQQVQHVLEPQKNPR